jgi:hypothetical protein
MTSTVSKAELIAPPTIAWIIREPTGREYLTFSDADVVWRLSQGDTVVELIDRDHFNEVVDAIDSPAFREDMPPIPMQEMPQTYSSSSVVIGEPAFRDDAVSGEPIEIPHDVYVRRIRNSRRAPYPELATCVVTDSADANHATGGITEIPKYQWTKP